MSAIQLRNSQITLEKILDPKTDWPRKTKIICTLGPACWDTATLVALIDQGMAVARLNFSHGDHESHGATVARLLDAMSERPEKHVAIMLDTKGPEIRTGFLESGDKVKLVKGQVRSQQRRLVIGREVETVVLDPSTPSSQDWSVRWNGSQTRVQPVLRIGP